MRDNVINQLLAKIDGVESLNNILIIGMTNRLDLIDEAILRPGRLEIHQEIGLPDEKGRKQIFEIHTRVPKVNGLLDDDVDLDYLASKTKNYTGAEIMGLCRTAISYTLYKDFAGGKIGKIDLEQAMKRKVVMTDFEKALGETKPQFGVDENSFESDLLGGFIKYSPEFTSLYEDLLSEMGSL